MASGSEVNPAVPQWADSSGHPDTRCTGAHRGCPMGLIGAGRSLPDSQGKRTGTRPGQRVSASPVEPASPQQPTLSPGQRQVPRVVAKLLPKVVIMGE